MRKPEEYLVITPNLNIVTVIPVAYDENGCLALGIDSDGATYGNADVKNLVGCNNTITAAISLDKPPTLEEIKAIVEFTVIHTEAVRTL